VVLTGNEFPARSSHVSGSRSELYVSLIFDARFNSIIFSTTSFYTYDAAQITEPLPEGIPWDFSRIQPSTNVTELPTWLLDAKQGRIQFKNLSGADCMKTYYSTFVSSSGNLILVTPNDLTNNTLKSYSSMNKFGKSGSLVTALWSPYNSSEQLLDPDSEKPQNWLCSRQGDQCPPEVSQDGKFHVNGTDLVKYCLSQEINEKCSVESSVEIITVVLAFVFTKIICMSWIILELSVRPLVVLGDAISSFVQCPDQYTSGACLGGPEIFKRDGLWIHVSKWDPKPKKWGQNVSAYMWLICGLL
jgi:hypothetical protein